MENYLVCVVALHKLMQIEQSLMKGIIAPTHQPRVFELIVRDAMDTIVQDGEVTNTMIKFFKSTFYLCLIIRQKLRTKKIQQYQF